MKIIRDREFSGERPLYASHGLRLENVSIHEGESAIKECSDIEIDNCLFEGKYVLWCCDGVKVSNSHFKESARSSVWYSRNFQMTDCLVEAPKMFREMDNLTVERCRFTDALESFWGCRAVRMTDCQMPAGSTYLFMNSRDVYVDNLKFEGKYCFQYCKNVEIHNTTIDTKDAFWETENVTVYDSVINTEYLAWYSKNLRLVRCKLLGTQPLCYAENLVLEDCEFGPDADLAFEYSTVQAGINGRITSVKNPSSGHIHASGGYGEIILDGNIKAPGDCVID